MSKPTLQEVKEYFKNAKEVKLCNTKTISKLSTRIFAYNNCGGVNEVDEQNNLTFTNGDFNCVWGDGVGYAEIISYKAPLYQLTAKEIVHAYENPQYLKDTFKECFETELEVGKWYKNLTYKGSMFFNDGKINEEKYCGYGFDLYGKWHYFNKKGSWSVKDEYEPATEKELEDALIKEAINRGYKKGTKVTSVVSKNERVCKDDMYYNSFESNQLLFGHECCIFMDGIWSEIIPIPTYTIQEAEEKFNIKIKAV